MKFAYFPGCSLEGSAKDYNISSKAICEKLGIEIEDIEDWNCCGASAGHSISHELSLALPARNIALAELNGANAILAPCSECFHNLRWANNAIKEKPEEKLKINKTLNELGLGVRGALEVRHLLDVIANELGEDELKKKRAIDISKLKVAPYYGCLVARPPDIASFDRVENPQSLDRIVKALGANVVNFEDFKTACCGGSLILPKEDVALKLIKNILLGAKKAGANCIVVPCPMCHMNVDAKQTLVEETFGIKIDLPVLYFTQLIGIAVGMNPKEVALEKNITSPKKILDILGIEFEESTSIGSLSIELDETGGRKKLIFELK